MKLTKQQKLRFKSLNVKHPKMLTAKEKYEFNFLLGHQYLNNARRKSYTRKQRQFYKNQGEHFLRYANNLQRKYKLKLI